MALDQSRAGFTVTIRRLPKMSREYDGSRRTADGLLRLVKRDDTIKLHILKAQYTTKYENVRSWLSSCYADWLNKG